MFIEFSVGNYRSFRKIESFSLVATKAKSRDPEIDSNNVFVAEKDLELLKSAAIYGANASGKSNLAKAMSFMRLFVVNSSKESQAEDPIDVEEFRLNTSTSGKPSFFQMVFLLDGKQYRYGFEVTKERVVSEWLFFVPSTKEAKLFERNLRTITIAPRFKEAKGLADKTRKNALFLSVVAQFNGQTSEKILRWFRLFNIISGLNDAGLREYTVDCLNKGENRADILGFIKSLDLSIDDIEVEEMNLTDESFPKGMPDDLKKALLKSTPKTFNIKTLHRKYDNKNSTYGHEILDMQNHESEGTNKLFSLAGPLVDTLKSGKILFIDEFDARLHPLISLELIKLFNSNKTNPRNAQIIFATHDTNLLSNKLLRRDQIWFAEKDREGSTHLRSLVQYKVRNDASYEDDYSRGRYGAVPFVRDLEIAFEK